MSDVTLEVGGRKYSVSCQDGQEGHVQHLASVIDAKLGAMGANLSSQEAKNLLFAALLLADELDEARRNPPAPPPAPPPPPPPAPDFDTERLAGQLERVATALENAAQVLEGGHRNA